MSITTGLNPQQEAAVTAVNTAVLVLAGPGSGKTRVLTHRIAYLIQEQGVSPWHIMAVTFTNKAAREMRERIERIQGENLRGLMVGTFHATCARILRREAGENLPGYTRDFVIFDSDDQKKVIEQAMSDLNIDNKRFNPNTIRSGISSAKNVLQGPDDYQSTDYVGAVVGRVYRRYQELLANNNAMDFDDLIMNTVRLFDLAPLAMGRYQEQYQHILVDEFQDTNLTQYGLIRRLTGQSGNLFAVGDADQSIYKWRGADVRNLQRFRQEYPDAVQVLLEQNYRSTQIILDAATAVIQKNKNRVHKNLFTERVGGEKIVVEEAYSDLDEAQKVVSNIHRLMLAGYNPGDFAVMYRTNAQSRVLEEAFVRDNMPYKLVGATSFYGRREIKDVLAYLRVVHNPADEISLNRIINVPRRGIGGKTWASLREWGLSQGWQPGEALLELARQPELSHPFNGRAYNALIPFARQLDRWQKANQSPEVTVAELLTQILQDIEYKEYLDDGTEEGLERWANVIELKNAAVLADEMPLAEFLEEIALVSEVDNLREGDTAVTLLTLHAAKGLEFPVVFLVGVEDGILPHSRSLESNDAEDLAEERRLFYVGLTRAMDQVFIYHAFQRMSWGRTDTAVASRFLRDLPSDLVKGGSAGARREASKQKASSWSWDSTESDWGSSSKTSGSSAASPRGSRPSYSWQDKEESGPQARTTSRSRIPSPEQTRQLPTPHGDADQPPAPKGPSEAQFKTGDVVKHAKFGQGTVITSKLNGADEEVEVTFPKLGVKKLVASLAKLEKV